MLSNTLGLSSIVFSALSEFFHAEFPFNKLVKIISQDMAYLSKPLHPDHDSKAQS